MINEKKELRITNDERRGTNDEREIAKYIGAFAKRPYITYSEIN